MRKELNLDDSEETVTYKVRSAESQGSKQIGNNTEEFKMKSISIETLIHNAQKQQFSTQVDAYVIAKQSKIGEFSPMKSPVRGGQGQQENQDQQNEEDQSEERTKRLIKFLRKISPLMEKQLSQNLPVYASFGKNEQPTFFKRQTRLTHTLQNLDVVSEEEMEISDVSWNATGVIVAAAYSKREHEGTCSHKSMICLWGMFKRNFKPTRPQVISTPNCINCITFHPKKPSIIACGSYVGEILLYDFSRKDEQLLSKTIVDDYFHRDLITKLSWWPFRPPGKAETNYNILSLGTDGKILLWEVPNASISEEATPQRLKMLLKYPIKGFLLLRKKEGAIIPVSGLAMNQSKINKNVFIVGSQGGSILKATLSPINHFMNTQSKALLDLQQTVKFKTNIYPFLLNLPPKNLPEVKLHIEKFCKESKIKEVQTLQTVFNSYPDMRSIYPNPVSYAYEALSFPISSISDNKYGLFIANGYDGYSRVYLESARINLESIEEGWEWRWVNDSHLMGGFIGQQWVVVDWITGSIVWSVGVGEGTIWSEQSRQVAIVCERTKVKIVELGDKLLNESEEQRKKVIQKIENLRVE